LTTRIFITHCCKKKDQSLRNTTRRVTPDHLYAAEPTRRFMQKCQERRVEWAIFSDKYGVYFPNERHGYYEKSPSRVLEQEFAVLLESFDRKLRPFDETWFYYPGRIHPLYRRLLRETKLRNRVRLFSHLKEIG
jgi:hypothetical protein